MTEGFEQLLEVNKFARRARHLRNFSRRTLAKVQAMQLISFVLSPVKGLSENSTIAKVKKYLSSTIHFISEILPIAPQKRLLFKSGVISISALLATSLTAGGTFTAASMGYSHDYIAAYDISGDVLVSDEDGYLVKINPQTDESNRIGLTDYAVHTVEDGETLSLIAEKYGVQVNTIMWENNISNAHTIRSGQALLIPPVDGISYQVNSGDSLEKIAIKYEVTVEAIIAQNGLTDEVIHKGQALFLPGAEPIQPVVTAANTYRNSTITRDDRSATAEASSATPAIGKIFIFPTNGKVSQGYHGGHYALDIADRSMPAIWAAGAGTIEKASSGTWGGGYGNHVIIDHGNGVKTLYAHMDSLNVYEGQWVNQGDVLGIMGNTGRVYGATGIHLHWEVHVDGVKENPYNYF